MNKYKTQIVKDVVKEALERLSEDKLTEVFDFVSYLLAKEKMEGEREEKSELDLDPKKDPILKYIGGVSHGSLAKDIDRELYGD
ncbi:hypothetical protein ES705_12843 [subsurface metagenome]|nr:hypothetical protein [Methanosarcinales archaeon]